jgi:4'-phosphopantetheinyl transferase
LLTVNVAWLSQGLTDVPPEDGWLSSRESAWVRRMRFDKRRSEFRMGRWTAKNAIALYLDRPRTPEALHAVEIDRAPGGAPAPLVEGQPAPVSISMTDRADQAICVVSRPGVGLGVDLELVEPRSDAFVADYLTEAEQRLVGEGGSREEHDLLANLIWCSKESALKVLRTGLRRDTRSVEVSFPEDTPVGGWSVLIVRAREGMEFPGWWRRYGAFLLTVTATAPFSPPRSLVDPPALATAVPGHKWMRSSREEA